MHIHDTDAALLCHGKLLLYPLNAIFNGGNLAIELCFERRFENNAQSQAR